MTDVVDEVQLRTVRFYFEYITFDGYFFIDFRQKKPRLFRLLR
jgi:hypothetical protein